MGASRQEPDDVRGLIQQRVSDRKVYWTYHVNIRLAGRHITRDRS